jgi:hypothetical protein
MMGCCGKNRALPAVDFHAEPRPAHTQQVPGPQYFEYVGNTGLTTVGPVTGRRYRFAHPGARLPIDARDAPSMAGVPNLRKAPAPE